jgi:hypothetical protein
MLWPISSARAAEPTLTVLEPADGATIVGSTVTVRVQTTNFRMMPSDISLAEYGQRPDVNRAGEGHVHLALDLQPLIVWDRGDTYTFENVPPGEHQLKVELANNDHLSLYNPVLKIIRFRTVAAASAEQQAAPGAATLNTGPEPTLSVLEPADGAMIAGGSVTVRIQTTNFRLTPSNISLAEYGRRPDVNRAGEGHVHLALDLGPLIVWDRGDTYTFENVPPGEHQLKVELANNDHSSLYTPVVKIIRFRTTDAPPNRMPATAETAPLPRTFLLPLLALALVMIGVLIRFYSQMIVFTEAVCVHVRRVYRD